MTFVGAINNALLRNKKQKQHNTWLRIWHYLCSSMKEVLFLSILSVQRECKFSGTGQIKIAGERLEWTPAETRKSLSNFYTNNDQFIDCRDRGDSFFLNGIFIRHLDQPIVPRVS